VKRLKITKTCWCGARLDVDCEYDGTFLPETVNVQLKDFSDAHKLCTVLKISRFTGDTTKERPKTFDKSAAIERWMPFSDAADALDIVCDYGINDDSFTTEEPDSADYFLWDILISMRRRRRAGEYHEE